MLTEPLANGYTEYPVDPFPPLMYGKHGFFENLPYLPPRYQGLLGHAESMVQDMAQDALAVHESGFATRSAGRTGYTDGPRVVGLRVRVPEEAVGGLVDEQS